MKRSKFTGNEFNWYHLMIEFSSKFKIILEELERLQKFVMFI